MMQEVYTDIFCSVNILQWIRRNYVRWTAHTGARLEVEYEETVSHSNIWITFNFYLCGSIWAENGYDN